MKCGDRHKTPQTSTDMIRAMAIHTTAKPAVSLALIGLCTAIGVPQVAWAQETEAATSEQAETARSDTECADVMQMVRWREDWSSRNELGDDGLCNLKQIPITDDIEVSFGGELRYRIEPQDGAAFGLSDESDTGHLFRALAHADISFGPRVRTFVEIGYHDAAGYDGTPPATAVDRLDLQQAFIDVALDDERRVQIRAGRQELSFGSGRLFALREGANVRLAFDGAMLTARIHDATVRGFYMRPVEVERGTFDDPSSQEKFYGIYASTPLGSGGPLLDLYWLGFESETSRYFPVSGDEQRHSFGLRLSTSGERFAYDVEGVWQTGTIEGQSIDAWTAAGQASYRLDVPGDPVIVAKAAIASGDDDPADGQLNSFNPLFPKLNYFVERTLAAPVNFYNVDLGVVATPVQGVTLSAKALRFWRMSLSDGVYAPPIIPLPINPAIGGRRTSDVAQIMADWAVRPNFILTAAFVHVDLASPYNEAGYGDTALGLLQARWRF